jgi:Holliday junction resolvasome RuvABC endonuclease subunit
MKRRLDVGVDTSSFGFHWVASRPIHSQDLVQFDFFRAKGRVEERWIHIYRAAYDFFCNLPDNSHVWCEEPLALPKNGKTTRILGISAGVIFGAFVAASEHTDATWYWVDVASWKRAVIHNGSAKKDEVREVVRQQRDFHLLLNWFVSKDHDPFEEQPDLYDAWALMKYGTLQEMK